MRDEKRDTRDEKRGTRVEGQGTSRVGDSYTDGEAAAPPTADFATPTSSLSHQLFLELKGLEHQILSFCVSINHKRSFETTGTG